MWERPPATVLFLKCWEISLLEIILNMKLLHGPGSFSPKWWVWTLTVCIRLFIWMMMRLMISGIKKSEFRQKEFSVLVRKITSGNMVQAPADPALRFIMTEEKNMAAESRDVP